MASVLKIRLHRLLITLICGGLLITIMQGTGWLVRYGEYFVWHRQLVHDTRSQMRVLCHSLSPLLQTDNPDEQRITGMLETLTQDQQINDATVYNHSGVLLARAGEDVPVRDRLALNGNAAASTFRQQLVEKIEGKNGIVGFLRLTLDSRPGADQARLSGYLTDILRVLMVLSLLIGVILARTVRKNST